MKVSRIRLARTAGLSTGLVTMKQPAGLMPAASRRYFGELITGSAVC